MAAPDIEVVKASGSVPATPESNFRRLLVVAPDYESTLSPQGLRWVKLSEELARLGLSVDVLTLADVPEGMREVGAGRLAVIPVFPGYFQGAIRYFQRRRRLAAREAGKGEAFAGDGVSRSTPLNWKGKLTRWLVRQSTRLCYPDLRREGLPFLRKALIRQLSRRDYSAAILSHEPPLALELAGYLDRAGLPIIADLGDPVLAPYTHVRWRKRALALESYICSVATIVVTSRSTAALMERRHRSCRVRKPKVVTQGFTRQSAGSTQGSGGLPSVGRPLRMVYTGRFYKFRSPGPLLDAIEGRIDVELVLAVPELPKDVQTSRLQTMALELHLGMDHAECVRLQTSADVLVIVGNENPVQTPGKLYEYLGIPAPILYIAANEEDEGAQLVARLRRGVVVGMDRIEIGQALDLLSRLHLNNELGSAFDLGPDLVASFEWSCLAKKYEEIMQESILSDSMLERRNSNLT